MSLKILAFGAVLAVAMLSGAAKASVVYATGFEPVVFTAGLPVDGQDGWTSRLGSPAGTVSIHNPAAGAQSLEFLAGQLPEFGFGFNLETVRKFLDFDVVAAGARGVNVSVDVRLGGPRLADDLVEAIFSAIDPSFQDYGQMQISADGHLYIYGSQFVDSFVGNVTLDAYHRLAMQIDFYARQTTFSVDDVDVVSFGFDSALNSSVFRSASLHMAAPTDPRLADPALYAAWFDNLRITTIPEPASSALLFMALICATASARRKARRTPRPARGHRRIERC